MPASVTGKSIEVWFQDEARVGQKGSLEYVWGPVGSRPPAVRDNRHDSAYVFGAICHARAVGVWDYLRGNKLSLRVWDTYEAIIAACKDAWLFLVSDPGPH